MHHENRKLRLLDRLKEVALGVLQKKRLKYDWAKNARKEQLLPQWNWRVWLILAGRGFGKTRTGAEAVRYLAANGYKNIALVGETAQEVRRVMLEGESGLLRIFPASEQPKYYPSRNLLLWKNGAKAMLFSSENPESLRGPQFDAVWIDELAKFRNAEECWRQIAMCLRLGQNPRTIVTTTPRPIKLLKDLMMRKDIHITKGSTFANRSNLSKDFVANIAQEYENTTFGQQELHGELIEKASFWTEFTYCDQIPEMEEIVIAVDPAITNNSTSDETGIIVVGRSRDKYYVLEDLSTKAKVQDWISCIIKAYYKYDRTRIIVEVNQGGDFIREFIAELDPAVFVEEVRATASKETRAQPVAILYQRGCVFHAHRFRELENQMLTFGCKNSSPDRVDALVWGILKLKQNRNQQKIVGIF